MQGLTVLIGGMILDVQAMPAATHATQPGGTVPGHIRMTSGGVARNVAHCLAALMGPENKPMLISIIGDDSAGKLLLHHWQSLQLPSDGILTKAGVTTPMTSYIFNHAGDVAASVADVRTVEDHLKPTDLQPFHSHVQQASILMLDANLSPETLEAACHVAYASGVPIWFEPVSVPKAVRATRVLECLTYISPNAHELIAMAVATDPAHNSEVASKLLLQMAAGSGMSAAGQLHLLAPFLMSVLKAGVKHVMLTMGSQGAAVCSLDTSKTGMVTHHLAASPARIVNTNGAGDCLVAGSLACLGQGQRPVDALAFGMAVAKEGLEQEGNVPDTLSHQALSAASQKSLRKCSTMHFRHGSELAIAKL